MSRYCLEIDPDANSCIVHQQKCSNLSHAELIPLGRVVDFGEYRSARDALREARLEFEESRQCVCCCGGASAAGAAKREDSSREQLSFI